jgi:putative methanogenesis marker protein 6
VSARIETRLIFIAPSSDLTPDQLVRHLHGLNLGISIKETCYGCAMEGPGDVLLTALSEARKLDPNRIFSKVRAFPVGDIRRCRAHHGSRPGFAQLQKEWKDLPMFEKGLACAARGEHPEAPPRPRRMSVRDLKKICDEECK